MALGLPLDRAIVMSGHQAEIWHCGILAKWFATQSLAQSQQAHAAWIVVDHDTNDPTLIHYPSKSSTITVDAATPSRAVWRWAETGPSAASNDGAHVPTSSRAPTYVAEPPDKSVCWSSELSNRLGRLVAALVASRDGSTSLAEQVTRAMTTLLAPTHGLPAPSTLFASQLSRTPIFQSLLRAMLADPVACVEAYNMAATSVPDGGIRPLRLDSHVELPLWSIARSRKPVLLDRSLDLSQDISSTTNSLNDHAALAPRALLMTAALRLGTCDLFIHGLGGGLYDQVTDAWINTWLERVADPALRELRDARRSATGSYMAPTLVVSATARLDFGTVQVPAPEILDRAIWKAHHARHEPSLLDGAIGSGRKRELVDAIAQAKASGDRDGALATYRGLHAMLDAQRASHQTSLAAFDSAASSARAARGLSSVVHDRTWAFPLHSQETLIALRDTVAKSLHEGPL